MRIRSTGALSNVVVQLKTTILDIIRDVCKQNGLDGPEKYYLAFNDDVLDNNETVEKTNLHMLTTSSKIAELCTKMLHLLKSSPHIGTYVVFTSFKKSDPADILNIQLPVKIEDVIPDSVKKTCEKLAFNKTLKQSNITAASTHTEPKNTSFIPLPVFGHTIIDDLPSMKITIPLNPDEFDWQILLKNLADDLEVDINDLVILEATKGSTNWKIGFKKNLLCAKEKLNKIQKKIVVIIKDTTSKVSQYIKKLSPESAKDFQDIPSIHVELSNFDGVLNDEIVIPDYIDLFYELNERPAIIEDDAWKFLKEKSGQINIFISDSFKNCQDEYVINSMTLVHNEKLANDYKNYSSALSDKKNERILFHGVKSYEHFDGIFEENLRFKGIMDPGYFGQGIYFTSSLKYALRYDWTGSKIKYILCNVISLGETLHVKDMSYYGMPLHPDYNSHYVKVDTGKYGNHPIKNDNEEYYEEFVIKDNKQILPLYIVGLCKIDRFVIWRDAKIKNDANANTFRRLKEAYNFNIYGSETSDDALKLLKCKLSEGSTQCVVVTNGADDGKGFAAECKKIRSNIPIIVYCIDLAYHQKWADELSGEPKIKVTGTQTDVFDYIKEKLFKK